MKHYTTTEFDKGNASAAAIILAGDPQTFGAGLVAWARAWQAGHPAREPRRWHGVATVASVGQVVQHGEQMEMFEQGAAEVDGGYGNAKSFGINGDGVV